MVCSRMKARGMAPRSGSVVLFLKQRTAYEILSRVEFRRVVFFFQAEDGIRDIGVTGVQTCALPICSPRRFWEGGEAMPAYLDCVACASTGAEATAAGALPCALSCASAMATGDRKSVV